MDVKTALLEKFRDGSFALLTDSEIAKLLRLGKRESVFLRDVLLSLCREGELLTDSRFRFGTAEQFGAERGTYLGNERGFGFVTFGDGSEDLFIPRRAAGGALHRDIVLACRAEGRSDDEGEVLAVLERGMKEVVGVYRRERQAGYLVPDDKRYDAEVYIPAGKSRGCKEGFKAVARIDSFTERTPVGEIVEVLGKKGDLFAEELSLIRAHKLREDFPEEVKKEALFQAGRPLKEKDLLGREDLRKETVITVDGEDTRDIDDAISVQKKEGMYLLGVHIADVSHYVGRGSLLDEEAYLRGTSVYFPDRVLPMLPSPLSNGICSLNEGEDRLTLSCFMTVNGQGRVMSRRIVPSVIRSRHRMTYTEVKKLMDGDRETEKKYPDLLSFIQNAVALTNILKRAREARGSVALDVKETKIVFSDGNISIPAFERTLAHEMIEEFMVLANESVASVMSEKHVPFLYRIHEPPSEEKAGEFASFLAAAGVKANFDPSRVTPRDYARLLSEVKGSPLFPLLNRVMLRSMMKARYSPENAGHFGLASDCYCHFTSPIRRYPDLCIHRIIKEYFSRPAGVGRFESFVGDAAIRTSECERNAAEAEREVDALYTAFYMEDKIGEEFDATVSGMNASGLFAELGNAVEGFLPLENLPEDDYAYLEGKYVLRGSRRSFALGQKVRVLVAGVDRGARRTLFSLIGEGEN